MGNGCLKSRPPTGLLDPRWDVDGFHKWCAEAEIAWIRVKFLRKLVHHKQPLPCRQEMPDEAVHVGIPPADVQLYGVNFAWQSSLHADPDLLCSTKLVEVLDREGALDNDLVFHAFGSIYQTEYPIREVEKVTQEEKYLNHLGIKEVHRIYLYFKVRAVVVIVDCHLKRLDFWERMWPVLEFCLSAYAQRIVNQTEPTIRAHMRPEYLMNFSNASLSLFVMNGADRKWVVDKRAEYGIQMKKAAFDDVGFQKSCQYAGFRWILVAFIADLAERGGPPPRCQDLPPGSYIDGAVPKSVQPFVVSYSWSSHKHPCPSGRKIRELWQWLQVLKAKMDDVVFLDWMSLWQGEVQLPRVYADMNKFATFTSKGSNFVELPDRSIEQVKQFMTCLFETTRLYAFKGTRTRKGCKVIILPKLEMPEDFPEHGDICEKLNEHCEPARLEIHTDWGFCKSIPYHRGGWTCAEYCVARKNGTIANLDDPDVVAVESSRQWPTSVAQYIDMMDEDAQEPVVFTKKGDREAVRFNFYKYSYAMLDVDQ